MDDKGTIYPDAASIPGSQLDGLLSQANSAIASNDDAQKAQVLSQLQGYESEWAGSIATGDQDQIDAAKSSLTGKAPGAASGTASPTGAFVSSLTQDAKSATNKVATAIASVASPGNITKAVDTIQVVLYILAAAIGLAIIVGIYIVLNK